MLTWIQDRDYTDGELEAVLFVCGVREEHGHLSPAMESDAFGAPVRCDTASLALALARSRGLDVDAIRERARAYAAAETGTEDGGPE